MDGRPTWTDCDEAGDYVVPNVLSPRDLVSRPDIMDKTVPHYKLKLQSTTMCEFDIKTKECNITSFKSKVTKAIQNSILS